MFTGAFVNGNERLVFAYQAGELTILKFAAGDLKVSYIN